MKAFVKVEVCGVWFMGVVGEGCWGCCDLSVVVWVGSYDDGDSICDG